MKAITALGLIYVGLAIPILLQARISSLFQNDALVQQEADVVSSVRRFDLPVVAPSEVFFI